jgi:hypothetical protein
MNIRIPLLVAVALIAASCAGSNDHTHLGFEIPDGEAVPTVELTAVQDSVSGWNLHLVTTNFAFAPQRAGREVVLGEGHAHLYVDGTKRDRIYGPWYHLASLEPGSHTIEVTLNSNDHAVYQVKGENIGDTVTVEVTDRRPMHEEQPPVEASPPMTVELRVQDDPVGGWNLFVDTVGFRWAPEKAGLETAGGEGHAHLHIDGLKTARIYGPATYLGSLDPGTHTVMVSLNGNNHAPYLVAGEPVTAVVTVAVPGEPGPPAHSIAVDVRAGEVQGGVQRIEATQGELIEITVTTDDPDSVHVHGYDLTAAVESNQPEVVVFAAKIQGIFEIELEQSGLLLAELIVR